MIIRKFDLELYPVDVIRRAASDYGKIAKILVVPGKEETICHFLWCKADQQRTVAEFSNYLIDLMGSRGNAYDSD